MTPSKLMGPLHHLQASMPPEHNDSPKLRKKAVLIGINYQLPHGDASCEVDTQDTEMLGIKSSSHEQDGILPTELQGCQRDALDMREFLIKHYQYKPEDTTLLIDKEGYLQPTKNNIIHAIKELVKGAQTGDCFFFHYSGHTQQEETDDITEEDGKDESIIPTDNEPIVDNELKRLLVDPLPIGSSLFAVFDSCSSGTLLDLPHINCNSVYVPWISKGKRGSATMQISIVRKQAMWQYSMNARQQARLMSVMTNIEDIICYNTPALPIPQCQSPTEMFCSGFCSNPPLSIKTRADVISISAAKDGQESWECANGESMTHTLIRNLSQNLHPRLGTLVQAIGHDLHKNYVDLHNESRRYRDKVRRTNALRKELGRSLIRGRPVEMVNFQDPQVSSHHPLNMNTTMWDP